MGKIIKNNRGFTLIEIVVAAGIMALFSLTLISVFLATVRSGSKAQLLQAGHQEGDFALRQMARVIRGAKEVSCDSNSDLITVTGTSGQEIVFSVVPDDNGFPRVASDSNLDINFLTGTMAEVTNLNFKCYLGQKGNQVVTITLKLNAQPGGGGQVQEQFVQEFATSVSTRQY